MSNSGMEEDDVKKKIIESVLYFFSFFTFPTSDDTIIFVSLIIFAFLFLFLFIKYLKGGGGGNKSDLSEVMKPPENGVNNRRFRFSRLRRNGRNKAWLDSLDPDELEENDLLNDHDADRLIQFDISTEKVLQEIDPMGTLSKSDSLNSANFKRTLFICQFSECIGIGMATILSVIFIAFFSNLDE